MLVTQLALKLGESTQFQSESFKSNLNIFVYWEMNSPNFCNKFPKLLKIS